MTASVEKKAVSENNEPVAEEKPQEDKKDTNSLTVEDIREHCKLIERSVVTKEARSKLLSIRRCFRVTFCFIQSTMLSIFQIGLLLEFYAVSWSPDAS